MRKKGLETIVSLISIPVIAVTSFFCTGAKAQMSSANQKQESGIEQTLKKFNWGWSEESKLSDKEKMQFDRSSEVFDGFLTPEKLFELTKDIYEIEDINSVLSNKKTSDGEFEYNKESIFFVNDERPFNLVYRFSDDKGKIYYGFIDLSECSANAIEKRIDYIAKKITEDLFSKLDCQCSGGINLNYNFARALINGEGKYKGAVEPLTASIKLSDKGNEASNKERIEALKKLTDGIYDYNKKNYELNNSRIFTLYTGERVNIAMRLDSGYSDKEKKKFCANLSFYTMTDNFKKFPQGISAANYVYNDEEGRINFENVKYIIRNQVQEYLKRHITEDITKNKP